MAQQKMLVALCLFGAVACCAAQNFNYQQCTSALRKEAERYRNSMMTEAQKFTQSIQETGNQAMDTSAFQGDLDKLTQSITNMADVSQGFDLSRFMSTYMDNLQTVSSLMRNSMRLSLFSGALKEYIDFGNSLYGLNTGFLERVTNSCMPVKRRIVLPAQQA